MNATVYDGKTASFSVTATGTGLSYQWQRYVNGEWLAAFETNPTATTANFVTVPVNTAISGLKIRCQITDSTGTTLYTDEVTLTVLPVPAITAQPKSVTVSSTGKAVFSVTATGEGLSYQWQYRTSSTGAWKNATATGNKTAALTFNPVGTTRNGYQYRCVVKRA